MLKSFLLASFAAVALGKDIESRIVGGNTAAPGQFPYQASVRRTATQEHNCGGVVANNHWLLCAAHCTLDPPEEYYIFLGRHFRGSGGTRFDVAQIINHPQFNPSTIANDVSVIRTTNPITFTNLIQPIALGAAHVGGGVVAVLSGWGVTSTGLAPELQYLLVQTHTNEHCRSVMGGTAAGMVFDHKICAGGITGQGACIADSGGPLAVGNTAIGIVSWVIPCGVGLPDVYERISYHRNWFLQHIEE